MIKRKILSIIVITIIFCLNTIISFGETNTAVNAVKPELKSRFAILTDQKTGKILFEKSSHEKAYPASLTKILTAILILENMTLDETVTAGKELELVEADGSDAGLSMGRKLTGSELLWALMLPSGNDAAYTAAVHIARKKAANPAMGIAEAIGYFAEMMNSRAREIGANESHFTNPDGYPDENHYSSAYDMALISREALKNEFFKEVVGTYTYAVNGSDKSGESGKDKAATVWYNKNQLINNKSKYYYEFAHGIKTGHTNDAGYCLSSYALMDDRTFISIVMKADTEELRWLDTIALFNYGFSNFKYRSFTKKGESAGSAKIVRKYFKDTVDINVLSDAEYVDILTDSDMQNVKRSIQWDRSLLLTGDGQGGTESLQGPVSEGQVLGRLVFTLDDKILFETNVLASRDALKGDFTDKLVGIIDFIIAKKFPIIICLVAAAAGIVVLVMLAKRKKKFQN